jgi:hypothetical protein
MGGALMGCPNALPSAEPLARPVYDHGGSKCTIAKSQAEPLVVDWSSVDRARLEALARSGAVPVAYSGCEMKILAGCSLPDSSYRYVGTTRKHDEDHIRTTDDLYAKMPVGAARLEGTLARAGELSVAMTIVGRYQLDRGVRKSDLVGECLEATHVISALTVGAFTFSAGARAKVGGDVSAFGASVGGSTESQRDVLTQDGMDKSCDQAAAADDAAPTGCGALIRIEVRVLPETAAKVADEEATREKTRMAKEESERDAKTRRTASYAFGIGGIALLGGGIASLAVSGAAKSSIEDGGLPSSADIISSESRARTFEGIGIAGVVVGGIGLVIGGVLFLGSSSNASPSSGAVGAAR